MYGIQGVQMKRSLCGERATWLVLAGLFLTLMLGMGSSVAQEPSAPLPLGELVVTASEVTQDGGRIEVTAQELSELPAQGLEEALDTLPAIQLQHNGARGGRSIQLRGVDQVGLPVLVDGVPVYVPYDGDIDLARIGIFSAETLVVEAGLASVLSGPNAFGGRVNVVSKRPVREGRQGEWLGRVENDGSWRGALQVLYAGTNLWAGVYGEWLEQEAWRLPDDYSPTDTEDGGDRENSEARDARLTLQFGGGNPGGAEWMAGYTLRRAEKQQPPYAGGVSTEKIRYWRWPQWNQDSVYLTAVLETGDVEWHPRIFIDRFRNTLKAYDDASYATQNNRSSFTSRYDDYRAGLSLEAASHAYARHEPAAALHLWVDEHNEQSDDGPWYTMRELLRSVAFEDRWATARYWRIVPGVGLDFRSALRTDDPSGGADFAQKDEAVLNPRVRAVRDLPANSLYFASVGMASRFPTMKDQYSYRLGRSAPNPDLTAEKAVRLETGFTSSTNTAFLMTATLFYSKQYDTIQDVTAAVTASDGSSLNQIQNVGESEQYGLETVLDWRPDGSPWSGRLGYQLLERTNLSSDLPLTGSARHSLHALLNAQVGTVWSLSARVKGASSRITATDGRRVSGYTRLDLFTRITWSEDWSMLLGVDNVLDEEYELDEGYPEPGRHAYVELRQRF